MRDWRDGRVKLATIALLLAFRREHAEFFADADYQPIEIVGEEANLAAGFIRSHGDKGASPFWSRVFPPCGRRRRTGAPRPACPKAAGAISSAAVASSRPGL